MSNKILGNLKRGLPFVLSGPTGTGKTTLIQKLHANYPCVVQSISYTTRMPRVGEVPGKDYHFVSLTDFNQMVANHEFLEHVTLYNHRYGTSKTRVEEQLNEGKHVILVIDTQGGLQLKNLGYPATYIFLKPPSEEELRRRLTGRHTETSSTIDERLKQVKRELSDGLQYDYTIVNQDLETAYEVLKSIIIAEEHCNSAISQNN